MPDAKKCSGAQQMAIIMIDIQEGLPPRGLLSPYFVHFCSVIWLPANWSWAHYTFCGWTCVHKKKNMNSFGCTCAHTRKSDLAELIFKTVIWLNLLFTLEMYSNLPTTTIMHVYMHGTRTKLTADGESYIHNYCAT